MSDSFTLDLSWKQVLKLFLIGECPIKNWPKYSFMWKCKPVTNLNDKFTYKFVKTTFPKKQDIKSFSSYFEKYKNKQIISFYNLKKTTKLIVPLPRPNKNFSHISLFLQQASKKQQSLLWNKIAKEIIKIKTNKNIIYLSTHGLGINYLHVRIKTTPDYGYPTTF